MQGRGREKREGWNRAQRWTELPAENGATKRGTHGKSGSNKTRNGTHNGLEWNAEREWEWNGILTLVGGLVQRRATLPLPIAPGVRLPSRDLTVPGDHNRVPPNVDKHVTLHCTRRWPRPKTPHMQHTPGRLELVWLGRLRLVATRQQSNTQSQN